MTDPVRADGGEDDEFYRRLVGHATEVFLLLDRDRTVRYASPAVSDTLGYDPETLVDERLPEYVHPDDWEAVADALDAAFERPDEPTTVEVRFRSSDESWSWFASTVRGHPGGTGGDGVLVSCHDITERVAQRQRLQRQNDRLNEFANVVSHDLRNPLNVAQGHAAMLAERVAADADLRTNVDVVRRSLDRMDDIIDDTLTLAREGQPVGEPEPAELATVARKSWESVATDSATLEVVDEATLYCDASRLRNVFENLFRNALDHGTDGDGHVTVTVGRIDAFYTTTRAADDGDGFYVEDDGRGIPPAEREAVFEPGHTSTESGTGFGLAIVKRIADAHGWNVTLREGKAGGARFEFTGVAFVE
ncbi:PAS domain-containing sensor histidine kinase [Halorubrum ejinorense]|uniref:histidine kinase n=1 Tax=Halorubrum ejinorense TaxID=425309 RepID=A0AAV3SUE2_9EURY